MAIVDEVGAVSAELGVPRGQVALAWLLAQAAVTSPVVSVTKVSHLQDAVAAVDLQLDADNLARLAHGYAHRGTVGHR